jgi:hypothetical protein
MDYHTVKSLEAALRGMPPRAPIMVQVGGGLHYVSLVRAAWVAPSQNRPVQPGIMLSCCT